MHSLPVILRISALILFILPFIPVVAQSSHAEQAGWAAWFNSYRLSNRFGVHLDVQARSADEWGYVKNLLVRPGITYYFNPASNATAGYALVKTYADKDIPGAKNLTEHRLWQQYVFIQKIREIPLTHRLRLEQRFIERASDDVFSQRLRYFARFLLPISKASRTEGFRSGPFIALQNEIFLTVQNKDQLNNSVFDQNRAYLAAGYRLSNKADLEAGYLNQYINGANNNTRNHVVQVALYTRF